MKQNDKARSLQRLVSLRGEWMRRSKRKFEDAELEKTEAGKRALNLAAFCYFNAAQELSSAICEMSDGCLTSKAAQSKTSTCVLLAIRAHVQTNKPELSDGRTGDAK